MYTIQALWFKQGKLKHNKYNFCTPYGILKIELSGVENKKTERTDSAFRKSSIDWMSLSKSMGVLL